MNMLKAFVCFQELPAVTCPYGACLMLLMECI